MFFVCAVSSCVCWFKSTVCNENLASFMPILDSPRKMSFHAAQYFSPFYAYSLLEAGGGV